MKLILTQEVDGLGAAGDVVEVKDGYGRNYLVPRGVAIRWTRGGEKQVESIKAARSSRSVRDHDHAAEIKAKLEVGPVDVKVRSGAGGRLFGAVTVTDIADAIAEPSPARASTSARSWSPTRSSRSAPTRSRSSCTTTCPPRWRSTSSPADPASPQQAVLLREGGLLSLARRLRPAGRIVDRWGAGPRCGWSS